MSLPKEDQARLEMLLGLIEEGSEAGALDEEIDLAEAALGRPLPPQLRAWVAEVDGAVMANDNLFLDPVWSDDDPDTSIGGLTQAMRGYEWHLPDQLVLIGGNGGDEMFGIWMPATGDDPHVMVGLDMGPGEGDEAFWIVGESFLSFLVGWNGAYAHFDDHADYDTLGIPAHLRQAEEETTTTNEDGDEVMDEDETLLPQILRFASPSIPEVAWPFEEGARAFTAEGLEAFIASLPRRVTS